MQKRCFLSYEKPVTICRWIFLDISVTFTASLASTRRRACAAIRGTPGARYLAGTPLPWTKFRVAVVMLNRLVQLLYRQRLTDEATCYKAFRTEVLRALNVQAS